MNTFEIDAIARRNATRRRDRELAHLKLLTLQSRAPIGEMPQVNQAARDRAAVAVSVVLIMSLTMMIALGIIMIAAGI